MQFESGHHLPFTLGDFNAKFTNGAESAPPAVNTKVTHPQYKNGTVTHFIKDVTIIHECTLYVTARKQPTQPWECSCVFYRNSLQRCDALMYLLVHEFKIDPLNKKLIDPIFSIACHPYAPAACIENKIGLPDAPPTLVQVQPRGNSVSIGMYLVDGNTAAQEIASIRSNVNASDPSTSRFHIMKNAFNRLVVIAQQSDALTARVVLALKASHEDLTSTCPAAGSFVAVDGRQVPLLFASGQAPVQKKLLEVAMKAKPSRSVAQPAGEPEKKKKKKGSCSFCRLHFDVDDSEKHLAHCNLTTCVLKHGYDTNPLTSKWQVSLTSTLGRDWPTHPAVEFKMPGPGGRTIFAEIPRERYPLAKQGDSFRLVMAGATLVFSEQHLQRAPLWSAHPIP